jgi:hypothetical protein
MDYYRGYSDCKVNSFTQTIGDQFQATAWQYLEGQAKPEIAVYQAS